MDLDTKDKTKKKITWRDLLSDDSPVSSMRFNVTLGMLLFMPAFTFVFVYVSVDTKTVADVPESVFLIILCLLLPKVIQKVIELKFGKNGNGHPKPKPNPEEPQQPNQ
ncbi:MAG: hypothetical protein MN733_23795 [Nitrososphaera sp.]|nr:hypothetical protein [Nitrososphaera sp.]MCI0708197.1 hypothetical protein [Ignavibacteriota bacterium]